MAALKKSNRLIFLAISLLVTFGTGTWMFLLNEEEKLWGHLPLLLFVGGWASIVLLRWNKHPKGLRWLALSTLSGVLLSVGFPPIPLPFLMFIGWVPLLIAEHEISEEKGRSEVKVKLFPYAYHTLVVWNVLTTYWVANTAFVAGIFAIWVNALLMYVPFLAFHLTKRAVPKLGYAAFIAFWLAFEVVHLNWELSWSWLTLGNAFASVPSWVQWYEYTGVFGGGLWILLVNVLIFKILRNTGFTIPLARVWGEQKIPALRVFTLVLLPLLISFAIYFTYEEKGRDVEVVVVQPNYEPHYEKFTVSARDQIKQFQKLSKQALTPNTEYLVFPESSFYAGDRVDFQNDPIINMYEDFMRDYPKLKLVTGVTAVHYFLPDEPLTRAARKDSRGNNLEVYNAAIQIQNGVDSIPFYVKSKLVPGAEITPYRELFFWLMPLVDKLGGSFEGHAIQSQREALPSNSGKIAPVICYESVFGDYHAGYMRAGAEAIFIMTNDGWWDNTAGHKQHLQFGSLRAIETRRPVARSANTGISCFMNQRGDILQPTKYEEEAAIRANIKFNNEITFYVQWGDLIGRIAIFTSLIFLLNAVVKG